MQRNEHVKIEVIDTAIRCVKHKISGTAMAATMALNYINLFIVSIEPSMIQEFRKKTFGIDTLIAICLC